MHGLSFIIMWSPTLSESTGVLLISKASRLATIASSIILDLELDLASDDSLSQADNFLFVLKNQQYLNLH